MGWGGGGGKTGRRRKQTEPPLTRGAPGPALRGGDSSERAVPRSLSAPRERPRPAGGERGRYGGGGRAGPRAGSRSGAVGPDRRGALPAALVPPRGGAWRAAARARRQPCRDPAGSGAVGALGRGCAPRRAVLRAAVTRLCAALRCAGRGGGGAPGSRVRYSVSPGSGRNGSVYKKRNTDAVITCLELKEAKRDIESPLDEGTQRQQMAFLEAGGEVGEPLLCQHCCTPLGAARPCGLRLDVRSVLCRES